MTRERRIFLLARLSAATLLGIPLAFAGCKSAPKKEPPVKPTVVQVECTADVNPDNQGRPSPLVIQLYQLRSDVEFNNAQYAALDRNQNAALGPSLVAREEIQLSPGDKRALQMVIAADTRFVAVVAGYREPTARWRSIQAISQSPRLPKQLHVIAAKTAVTLTAEN